MRRFLLRQRAILKVIFYLCATLFISGLIYFFSVVQTSGLARYVQHVRQTPVFPFAGVNIERAHSALDAISDGEAFSDVFYPENPSFAFGGEKALRGLLRAEERRRAFLEHPSLMRAIAYHNALQSGLRSYTRTLSAYHSLVTKTRTHAPQELGVAFPQGKTTLIHYAATVARALSQSTQAQQRATRGFMCLWRDAASCASVPTLEKLPVTQAPSPYVRARTHEEHMYAESAYAFAVARNSYGTARLNTPGGHHIPLVEIESRCAFVHEPSRIAFAGWIDTSRHRVAVEAAGITSAYDMLFHAKHSQAGTYLEALESYSDRYVYQSLNPYLCADYAEDITRILTTWYTFDAAQRLPPPMDIEIRTALVPFQEAARNSSLVLSFEAAERLAQHINKAIEKSGYDGFEAVEGVSAREWADLATTIVHRTGYFELALGAIDDSFSTTRHVLTRQYVPYHAYLLTRTHPSVMFAFPALFTESEVSLVAEHIPPSLSDAQLISHRFGLVRDLPYDTLAPYVAGQQEELRPLFKETEVFDFQ